VRPRHYKSQRGGFVPFDIGGSLLGPASPSPKPYQTARQFHPWLDVGRGAARASSVAVTAAACQLIRCWAGPLGAEHIMSICASSLETYPPTPPQPLRSDPEAPSLSYRVREAHAPRNNARQELDSGPVQVISDGPVWGVVHNDPGRPTHVISNPMGRGDVGSAHVT
jgi:hypothetical protein